MASFTDQPIQFNPYIETTPVQAMVAVGMQKEQDFKQGIAKVQAYVDTIAGLDIVKEEGKQYVASKLNEVKQGIAKNLSGDFSDSRITNQIGGAAVHIYKDPIVQNAVISTGNYRKGIADIEAARKAGKSNIANETVFTDSANEWLSDKNVSTPFKDSFTPYTDKIDIFLKYWKETNPTENPDEDMTRINSKGEREINPVIFKGKTAEQVQAVWNLVKGDANVQQQLQIDGKFMFRGKKPSEIYQGIEERANQIIKKNEELILSLSAKAAVGDKDAQASIQSLKELNKGQIESLSTYKEGLTINPDAVKANIVSQQTLSSLIGAYTSKVMEKNPLWETSFEMSKWNIQMQQWSMQHKLNLDQFAWKKEMEVANYNLAATKEAREAKKAKEEAEGVKSPTALNPTEVIKNENTAREDISKNQYVYTQSMRELAYNLAVKQGVPVPYYKDDATGTWVPNVGTGKDYKTENDANAVAKKFFDEAASSNGVGTLIQNDKKLYDLYTKSQDNYANLELSKKIVNDVETAFTPQTTQIANTLKEETKGNTKLAQDFVKANIVKNKLPGWQTMEIGLKQEYGDNWEDGMKINTYVTEGNRGEIISTRPNTNAQAYEKASKKLKNNPTFVNLIREKEAAYMERQKSPVGYTVTVPSNLNDITRTNYASAVTQVTDLNPGSDKGDYKKFESLLFGKPDVLKQNIYSRYLNPTTQEGFLSVQNGEEKATIKIPGSEYLRMFPEENQYSAFRQKFQTKLNLNRGMYTGNSFTDAYQAYQGPGSPYIVKYNVISNGEGAHKLRWWVAKQDRTANKTDMIIDGEIIGEHNGLNQDMSEEAIMAAVNKLQDKNWVELNIAQKIKSGR